MLQKGRLVAQARPSTTDPTQIYQPADGRQAVAYLLIVCNLSSSARTFRVFLDADGTTYDESTAIFYDRSLGSNETRTLQINLKMNSSSNLAVRSSSASDVTFTLFAVEDSQ